MYDRERLAVRELFLRALVFFGAALFAITEGLSAVRAIQPIPLLICWIAALLAVSFYMRSRRTRIHLKTRDPVVLLGCSGVAVILILTAITAGFSPPNSADAMAYHTPRVVYWAEQGSVRFFPTPYLNQIMLQPLAEYCMLHTYVLSGGDHWINGVQWLGSLGSVIGVSSIAGMLGASARGQAIAALFCATLPPGILASSGAKNDYFLAMWLVAALNFAARFARSQSWMDAITMGIALGLAFLTKATAYLFAPFLLVAILLPYARSLSIRRLIAALACALLLNAPHYLRNLELSGSILGFDSAQGDSFFRWRNETLGWKQTASNFLRHVSEQLGGRSERWNGAVFDAAVRAQEWIGIDANDPATTWPWTRFAPPVNANHEANANSKWHLLILGIAVGIAIFRRHRAQLLYALALVCGFVAFCAYLKWQPDEARLFLPLLVAGSAVAAILSRAGLGLSLVLCLFLLSTARRPVLENWVRPLKGEKSVLRVPRDRQYFSDMVQWNNEATYEKTVALLTGGDCRAIGIDSTNLSLEYPLMALIRERMPQSVFLHTGVANASSRFPQPVRGEPCAVVCMDCTARESLYTEMKTRTVVDKFVVYR